MQSLYKYAYCVLFTSYFSALIVPLMQQNDLLAGFLTSLYNCTPNTQFNIIALNGKYKRSALEKNGYEMMYQTSCSNIALPGIAHPFKWYIMTFITQKIVRVGEPHGTLLQENSVFICTHPDLKSALHWQGLEPSTMLRYYNTNRTH